MIGRDFSASFPVVPIAPKNEAYELSTLAMMSGTTCTSPKKLEMSATFIAVMGVLGRAEVTRLAGGVALLGICHGIDRNVYLWFDAKCDNTRFRFMQVF